MRRIDGNKVACRCDGCGLLESPMHMDTHGQPFLRPGWVEVRIANDQMAAKTDAIWDFCGLRCFIMADRQQDWRDEWRGRPVYSSLGHRVV